MGAVASNLVGAGGPAPPPTPARRGDAFMANTELVFESFCTYQIQTMKGMESYEQVPASLPQSCYVVFGKLIDGSNSMHLHPPFLVLYPADTAKGLLTPTSDTLHIFTSRTLRSIVYYRGEVALETMPLQVDGEEIRRRVILRVNDPAVSKKFFKEMAKSMTVAFRTYWEKVVTHKIAHANPGFAKPIAGGVKVEGEEGGDGLVAKTTTDADAVTAAVMSVLKTWNIKEGVEKAGEGEVAKTEIEAGALDKMWKDDSIAKLTQAVRQQLAADPKADADAAADASKLATPAVNPNAHLLVQPKAAVTRPAPEARRPFRNAHGYRGGGGGFNNDMYAHQDAYMAGYSRGSHTSHGGSHRPGTAGGMSMPPRRDDMYGRGQEWRSRGPYSHASDGYSHYMMEEDAVADRMPYSSMPFNNPRLPPGLPDAGSRFPGMRGAEPLWGLGHSHLGEGPRDTIPHIADLDDSTIKVDVPADLAPAVRGFLAQLNTSPTGTMEPLSLPPESSFVPFFASQSSIPGRESGSLLGLESTGSEFGKLHERPDASAASTHRFVNFGGHTSSHPF